MNISIKQYWDVKWRKDLFLKNVIFLQKNFYMSFSEYWLLNPTKLIENADTRKSVKYLFTKNIIFQRAVREDKAVR